MKRRSFLLSPLMAALAKIKTPVFTPVLMDGTPYVPTCGPAYLHKGERILRCDHSAESNAEFKAKLEELVAALKEAPGVSMDVSRTFAALYKLKRNEGAW